MRGTRSRPGLRRTVIGCLAIAVAISVGPVVYLRWLPPPSTSFMLQARLHAYRDGIPNYRVRYEWSDWQKIADAMKIAALAAEDQRFPFHHGFDFTEIQTAIQRSERPRGASTITQQVAKNLFLWPGRSYLRKALEAYFTVLLEVCWPKQRILETYLNIAQFGDGIYGVTAASRAYFGVTPIALTPARSALLAAVLPNPLQMRAASPSGRVRSRQTYLLRQMERLAYLDILKEVRNR